MTAGLSVPLLYLAGLLAVAGRAARGRPAAVTLRLPAVLAVGTILGIIGLATGVSWLDLGFLAPLGYAVLLLFGSAVEGRYLPWRALFWMPLVCATMHVSWGLGFLVGLREQPRTV